MKKITDLFEKLAGYQLDSNETKNIKGGVTVPDLNQPTGISPGGGDPPPFG